jgi:hypothetical protein
MNVLAYAAKAIKRLEDDGLERRAPVEEQSHVRKLEHDRHDLSQGVVSLRRLIDRYCETDDKHFRGLLTAIEEGILYRLDDEANTWLTAPGHVLAEGRPRRADLDRLAGIVLSLAAEEHWSIRGAAHAVADLVDAVWAGDPRTKARSIAQALWGQSFSDLRRDRIETLAEALRQRAQSMKRSWSQNSST